MKKRQAWKIFVRGPINWDYRLNTWDKAINKLFKSPNGRKGWKNLMRGKPYGER